MNIDETDIKKLTIFTDKYARMPDFAPDEQKVVFTVSNETTAGIYIMNANGSGVQALLVDDYKNSGPCWGNVVLSSFVLFDTG
jgi:Tol biopolymer transport system component